MLRFAFAPKLALAAVGLFLGLLATTSSAQAACDRWDTVNNVAGFGTGAVICAQTSPDTQFQLLCGQLGNYTVRVSETVFSSAGAPSNTTGRPQQFTMTTDGGGRYDITLFLDDSTRMFVGSIPASDPFVTSIKRHYWLTVTHTSGVQNGRFSLIGSSRAIDFMRRTCS